MLRAYPPEPRTKDQKLLWTKTCEKLKYRYRIENEYQLEELSAKAYSSIHHAVSGNAKLTEVVDRFPQNFVGAFAAPELAVVHGATQVAIDLRNETMKLWTNLRSADEICHAIHATEGNNLYLGKVLNGVCVVEDAYLFSSLKGQLCAVAEQQRSTVLASVYSMIELPGFPLTSWANLKDYVNKMVSLQVAEKRTSRPRETALSANQTALSTTPTHNSRSIVCFRCAGPHPSRGDA